MLKLMLRILAVGAALYVGAAVYTYGVVIIGAARHGLYF